MKINFDLRNEFPKDSLKVFNARTGDILLSENGNLDKVICITKGQLRLYTLAESGQELTLHYLSENDICLISASCAIGNQNFPVSVIAKEDTEFMMIGKDQFYELVTQNKDLFELVLSSLGARVLDLIESVRDHSFLSLRQRVVKFLLKNHSDGIFQGSHEKIAQELGTSREVVSRSIKSLVSAGCILSGRGKISLLKIEEMRSLCD